MLKPKAALVKSGFLPAGSENQRGRMSAAMDAECQRLVANEGYSIIGYEAVKPSLSLTKSDGPAPILVKKSATADPSRIADVPEPSRDERDWTATAEVEGKTVPVGMRTVDNLCRNSLTYCRCAEPRVWVSHTREAVVYFHPIRKG